MADNFLDYKVVQPAGVNFSLEESQLENTKWDNANEVSFRYGVTKKVTGYEEGFGPALTRPEVIVPLRDDSGNYYWWTYAGYNTGLDADRVYRITSTSETPDDVTPDTLWHEDPNIGWDRPYTWNGDSLNGVPYIVKGVPYRWGAVSSASDPEQVKIDKYVSLTNFPTYGSPLPESKPPDPSVLTYERIPRVDFKIIRTYRNYMVGLNFHTSDYDAGDDFGPIKKKDDVTGVWDWDWDGYYDPGTETSTKKNYGSGWASWADETHQNALWWSHFATNKDIDVTWKDADPTKNGGWNFLGGSGGPIVDGKSLRDTFFIYRERSIWQMQYVGGINVFAFKECFDDAGALSLDCVSEVEGWHYVVGQSDIYKHNGVQKQTIADGVVRRKLFDSIHPDYTDNVFITTKYDDKEIWVCIPDSVVTTDKISRDPNDPTIGSCTTAYVYNWVENHWSRKSLPDVSCAVYTILSIADFDVDWDAVTEGGPLEYDPDVDPSDPNYEVLKIGKYIEGGTWEESSDTWNDSFFRYNPATWGQAMGSSRTHVDEGGITTNTLYTTLDNQMFNNKNFVSTVEKKWIEPDQEKKTTSHVSRLYPTIRNGKVNVYMGGTQTRMEGINWEYIGEFNPDRDMHIACRITGRYIHVKFEIPETSRAEIAGWEMEYTPLGRR